jgi:hypothetical protein
MRGLSPPPSATHVVCERPGTAGRWDFNSPLRRFRRHPPCLPALRGAPADTCARHGPSGAVPYGLQRAVAAVNDWTPCARTTARAAVSSAAESDALYHVGAVLLAGMRRRMGRAGAHGWSSRHRRYRQGGAVTDQAGRYGSAGPFACSAASWRSTSAASATSTAASTCERLCVRMRVGMCVCLPAPGTRVARFCSLSACSCSNLGCTLSGDAHETPQRAIRARLHRGRSTGCAQRNGCTASGLRSGCPIS